MQQDSCKARPCGVIALNDRCFALKSGSNVCAVTLSQMISADVNRGGASRVSPATGGHDATGGPWVEGRARASKGPGAQEWWPAGRGPWTHGLTCTRRRPARPRVLICKMGALGDLAVECGSRVRGGTDKEISGPTCGNPGRLPRGEDTGVGPEGEQALAREGEEEGMWGEWQDRVRMPREGCNLRRACVPGPY